MKVRNRLNDWKDFRKSLNGKNENEIIHSTINYWSKKPIVNFVLNYNTYETWPTPWEIISEDYFDSICIAYLMMETLISLGFEKDRFELRYIKPDADSDYIMILILDNKHVFNYSYNELYDISNVSYINCMIKLRYIENRIEKV
ncbi:MAG: putative periplasmic protein [Caudoviricetes sp.]|nr:MAG: putative periplasmic protein [Caudoviricetes sp.]